jgi:tetratricopeptide (TPR) repeat protein
VPVIGVVQVGAQSMADRYTYVPAVGIFILITWTTAELVPRLRLPRAIPFAGATVVLVSCSILTVRQLRYWLSSETSMLHAVAAGQDCGLVELYLALDDQGPDDQRLARLRRVKELNPSDGNVRLNLGIVLDKTGRVNDALVEVQDAIRIAPTLGKAHFHFGRLLEEVGKPE